MKKNDDMIVLDILTLLVMAYIVYQVSKVDFDHVGAMIEKFYPAIAPVQGGA